MAVQDSPATVVSTVLPSRIRKRDGRIVPFDIHRIESALARACRDAKVPTDQVIEVARMVVRRLSGAPTVEQIQDTVVHVLALCGLPEVSTHYQEYRDAHKALRASRPIPDDVRAAFAESATYFESPIQQFVFYNAYSRFSYELGRRETWPETIQRAMDFLQELCGYKLTTAEVAELHDAMLHMEALPSMRLLAMAGEAARRQNAALYNCAFVSLTDVSCFKDILVLSMAGAGVGFSVERACVRQLPPVEYQLGVGYPFTIEDTTEGWGEALQHGMSMWFAGADVLFDYSAIRPAGSVLRVKGGRASGSGPLRQALDFTRKVILGAQGRQLTSLEVHDIACSLGGAAVAGGVRRSALLSLFDVEDEAMLTAKTGDFERENPQRWNANNSAVIPKQGITRAQYDRLFDAMLASGRGEPGLFSREAAWNTLPPKRKYDPAFGVNPCLAPGTMVHTRTGHFAIETLVGKEVEIWNGRAWQKVDNFRVTAENQPILKIVLQNGLTIRATPQHTMILEDGRRCSAQDLKVGAVLKEAGIPGVEAGDLTVVVVEPNGTESKVYCCTVEGARCFALSGCVSIGNCGEIVLKSRETCNLSIAVARVEDTPATLHRKARLAAIIGTIQSMATHFPGLHPDWKTNAQEERLLGVDVNGQRDCPLLEDAELLVSLHDTVVATNEVYAKRFGINSSVATTCVKPSGNSGVLLNCSSGLHPRWSAYYIRRIRVNAHDPLYHVLKASGVPLRPENGQEATTARTWVVSFPVKAPEGTKTRHDLSAIDQLEYWALLKTSYTEHNPSISCSYKPHEVDSIREWVWENRKIAGGLTFYPADDALYEQAPYEEITKEQYEEMMETWPTIAYEKIWYFETNDLTNASTEKGCSAGACEVDFEAIKQRKAAMAAE